MVGSITATAAAASPMAMVAIGAVMAHASCLMVPVASDLATELVFDPMAMVAGVSATAPAAYPTDMAATTAPNVDQLNGPG